MELHRFGPDDLDDVRAYVEVDNAVRAADSPWERPQTEHNAEGSLRHGWDGQPDDYFLATVDGKAVGFASYYTSKWDNFHLAWTGVAVHPAHRRQGHGSAMLDAMVERARSEGRTTIGIDAWDAPGPLAFAARHGLEQKSVGLLRRQFLAELDRDLLARLFDEALPYAAAYELVRLAGASPEQEIESLAEMAASINDAPTDDLDVEDEVFNGQRIREYEQAQLARGHRLYRVAARHRETGAWAGQTVVAVDGAEPHLGDQHDTSVVRAHRGHRLGLLLKLDMLRWLAEAEPQVREIDTWNAESNDHMIDVNEALGYRVMGRGLDFQKRI